MATPTSASPIRVILVGVDGSAGATRALEWAAARAGESGASLLAVHVLTYSAELRRDLSLETVTTWRRHLDEQLRGAWTEPTRRAGTTIRTDLVEDESVAAGLLHAADRPDVDLVVLGAKGHGTFAERLLGATTYKVSHAARTPVVIVPNDWQPRVAA